MLPWRDSVRKCRVRPRLRPAGPASGRGARRYRGRGGGLVRAACRAKGIDMQASVSGEEWLSGPSLVIRNIRLLQESLQSIEETGGPPSARRNADHGKRTGTCPCLPNQLLGQGPVCRLLRGRLARARSHREGRPGQGWVDLSRGDPLYGRAGPWPATCLHRADGRPVQDARRDRVVILKMNPVNDHLGPIFERALASRSEGLPPWSTGAEVGAYLCQHEGIDSIHITGSHHTHDAIVWGCRARARAASRRMIPSAPRRSARSWLRDSGHRRTRALVGRISPTTAKPGDDGGQQRPTAMQESSS